ncbi:hypothetical protein HELRODRAFT_177728 [Helobdella robusta]|uniref:Carboxylesterase type B domain-containing protein n=1 Tax=Helobdella robusta TaxID=6412 RepID=T1FC52_HELRO|nr:hypothetical protein HELRODRAFT_177728 [Helobdella robusta]ESN97673.1 hypothetical protein HELRODRAFT_177728 [Helobdella robusta]
MFCKSSKFSSSHFLVDYRPIVDMELMLEHPREALKAERYLKVPFYTGVVQNEFSFLNSVTTDADGFKLKLETLLNEVLSCKSGDISTIINSVKLNYIDWSETQKFGQNNGASLLYRQTEVINDVGMIYPSIFISDLLSATNPDVFYYYFEHEKSLHIFDMNYYFGVPFGNEPVEDYVWNKKWNESTVEDQKLSEKMLKLWVSIFQNSKPDPIDNITWPRYNKTTQHYITISTQPTTIRRHFDMKNNYFWNSYMPEFFENICGNSMYDRRHNFSTVNDDSNDTISSNDHCVFGHLDKSLVKKLRNSTTS